jgi:hypothetical protein
MDIVRNIKVSKTKKTERTAVLQDTAQIQYHPFDVDDITAEQMDDPEILNNLVKMINKLDKPDHEEIYRTVRKFKPLGFFAVNSMGTHFNIFSLDNKMRWELYRMVSLCMDNQTRNKVIAAATNTHHVKLTDLDTKMDATLDPECIECVNPTEAEKTIEMKRLNMGSRSWLEARG